MALSWGSQKSYIDASSAQVTAPGLLGGFSFRGLKKPKGGIHESTARRKEHSKTEFGKKNSEKKFGESETFYRSKFCRATGVTAKIEALKRKGKSIRGKKMQKMHRCTSKVTCAGKRERIILSR